MSSEELKKDENRCCENGFFGDKHTCMKEELKKEFWRELKHSLMWRDSASGIIESRIDELLENALAKQQEEFVKIVEKLKENWEPAYGYDCEEEKGWQKGIKAQIALKNKQIDEVIADIKSS